MSTGPNGPSTPLLAVDTGGTFTDLVLLADGAIETLKVPSTPEDPAEAVLEGIRQMIPEGRGFLLLHGSTVATNALLERKGARVVLVTNEGFEDIIEIGRQNRPQLYALVGHRLQPLVDRGDRIGVAGRLGATGEEIAPLDTDQLTRLIDVVRSRGAESVAVALLHSYANAAHEQTVADSLAESGLPVSVSSSLVPEFREYERTSTTVVNAYVAPMMDRYLGRLASEAGAERVTIMGSNGGALPVERARREPVHTVLSGPAGGVVGALTWARRVGCESVISFDMGGTSTDVSLCPGRPLRTREFAIAGQPTAIPVIDIHTVGAGGGSIARVDPGGALRVGPRSAGADPGPICYGRGGTRVTVTDAHVWLGRLPTSAFLGGEQRLDRDAIRPALASIAEALGGSLDAAAEGILAVADTAMEGALRVISVERGYDPIDFAVVGFGGAGALHVAELASRLGASKAIVPPDPGLLSAYGMLASPLTKETSRTVFAPAGEAGTPEKIRDAFGQLEAEATEAMLGEGSDPAMLTTERRIDARYQGQSFELSVPASDWIESFHRSHIERYGYERRETEVEAVTLRVTVTTPAPSLLRRQLESATDPPAAQSIRVTCAGEVHEARLIDRQQLRSGHRVGGPAVIHEYSGTTWVPPDCHADVDAWGCLHLSFGS